MMIDPVGLKLELQEIAAESIGWIPLQVGSYLHVGSEECEIIEVDSITLYACWDQENWVIMLPSEY